MAILYRFDTINGFWLLVSSLPVHFRTESLPVCKQQVPTVLQSSWIKILDDYGHLLNSEENFSVRSSPNLLQWTSRSSSRDHGQSNRFQFICRSILRIVLQRPQIVFDIRTPRKQRRRIIAFRTREAPWQVHQTLSDHQNFWSKRSSESAHKFIWPNEFVDRF